MRKQWLQSLTLSLGLLGPAAAWAADPAAPATIQRPVALTAAEAVSLGRPVGVGTNPNAPPILDLQVRPTGYDSPVVPGQIPGATIAQPLPVGASPMNPNASLHAWRRYDEPAGPPETAPSPTKIIPSPVPGDGGSFLAPPTHGIAGDDCGGCPGGVDCAAGGGGDCCGWGWGWGRGSSPDRWYISAEYLLFWFKGQAVPPLVTSGSLSDTIPGALPSPGTNVLFGGRDMENGAHSGGRFMAGWWFCDDHALGIEGGYFFLAPGVTNFSASSNGTPILTRPFIDAATGTETTELVAGPNVLRGTVSVQTRSSLWGAEANLRSTICSGCDWHLDVLGGFRTMGLDEDLLIQEHLTVLTGAGGGFDVVDHFRTQNRFYGGQLGTEWQWRKGRWDLDIKSKFALGTTQQMVSISGSDVITDPTLGTRTFNGGLLAQASNIGNYQRDRFTFVSDTNFTVGYHLTERLRCFAGYNFIYWSSVARPGPQIDRTVNVNEIAPPVAGGPARPAFSFNGSDFWAQGLNIGLEYKW